MDTKIINGEEFRRYKDSSYFVSIDGKIYSEYFNKFKSNEYMERGYQRVTLWKNGKSKHKFVHQMVFETWVLPDMPIEPIDSRYQVNHKDDDRTNTHASNLYLGTQKDNIQDCIRNNHRVGDYKYYLVRNKLINKNIIFLGLKSFSEFTGHFVDSVCLFSRRKWLIEEYELLEYGSVETIENLNKIREQSEKEMAEARILLDKLGE